MLDAARRGGLEREELSAGIKEALDALAGLGHEAEKLKAELAALNSQAMGMERDRDDLESGRLRLRREISEAERELQRLQGEFAKSDGRMRAAEDKAGYSRAVEAVRSAMKRQMLQGLYGTIAELGNVASRYSAALEVAAGARLQSVVAANDADASAAIEYLKRSQIGRATFLPLNKLERGSLPSRPNHEGVVDYALNLVEYDAKFLPAFWYVFRDTLVVESLSHARPLMGRYRMVTLEGDLVEKSGAMTGGHYRSRMKFAAEEKTRLLELSEKIAGAAGRANLPAGQAGRSRGADLPPLPRGGGAEQDHLQEDLPDGRDRFLKAAPGEVHPGEARASAGHGRRVFELQGAAFPSGGRDQSLGGDHSRRAAEDRCPGGRAEGLGDSRAE